MSTIYEGMETWLVAERQQMAQPDALTAFLTNKNVMLNSVCFDPEDPQNWGSSKARSHIGQCAKLLEVINEYDLEGLDRDKKLGELASKTLKVATGYSMRAGYFHPSKPEGLYKDRMVGLVGADGERLSVLCTDLEDLEKLVLDRVHSSPSEINHLRLLLHEGQRSASDADYNLRDLLQAERDRNKEFSGSLESQRIASELTVATQGLFVALGVGALKLQQEGSDGLGPIILQPRSDAQATCYLRIESLQATVTNDVTNVTSPNTVPRS